MLKVYCVPHSGADRHLAARTLLRWKYEELWEQPLPEIAVTERGKPYFADGAGYFSLSYTKTHAFCALCDGPVGLDAEQTRGVGMDLARRVLSQEEWRCYSVSDDPTAVFLRFWTLKEAFAKFTGEGIRGDLRELSFDLGGDAPVLRGREDLRFWSSRVDDFVIALCADAHHRPEFYRVEL